MQRLKSFVVRQLADALSDYVEGITPETVQASLGADTGALDLKAHINPAVLRPLGLELISSAVDLHVSIPWRHLESQPCVFEVRSLLGEVSLRPGGAPPVCDGPDLERARADKELAVAKLEAAEAARQAGDQGMAPGRVARASHAILRQLQASIHNVHIQLDRAQWSQAPVSLGLESVQLQSVGSDWRSAPDRDSRDLFKVFELKGLELREDGAGLEKILGPVALEAKLHHAASERMVHLQLSTRGDTPATLRPDTVRLACRCLASVMAGPGHAAEGQAHVVALTEEAGRDYAKLYTRKLRGEALNLEDLRSIEDAAPAEWIAAWRIHVRKLQKEASLQPRPSTASRPARASWTWTSWATGSRGQEAPEQQEPLAALDDFVGGAVAEGLLDDAIGAGLVPEVELPMEIKVDLEIVHVMLRCVGSSSSLRFDVQDAACCVEVRAKAPQVCQTTTHLWDVDGRAHLASLTVQLGSEPVPLVELGRPGQSEHALDMRLELSQRDALVSGSPPFDARLEVKKKAILVRLASWRLHGVLATAVDIAGPLLEWCREGGGLPRPAGEPCGAPSLPPGRVAPQAGASAVSSFASVASESSTAEATVRMDVSIEAPILHWEVPHGAARLEMRLGHFCARTGSHDGTASGAMWTRMPEAAGVSLVAFGCACELKDTSAVLVRSSGDPLSVYALPNLRLQFGLEPGGATSVRVASNDVRVHVNSELTRFLGQSRAGLDYAIAPLARLGAGAPAAPAAPPAPQQLRAPGDEPPGAGGAAGAGRELRVDVDFGHFEICLGNALLPAASLSVRRATLEVAQSSESLGVKACLAEIGVRSSEHALVDCARVAVKVSSVPAQMETELTMAPLRARWAAAPARRALGSAQEAARGYDEGKRLASQEQPPSDDGSALSLYLWNAYVKERAEKLGEDAQTYVQQELGQLGLSGAAGAARATPSSSQVSLVRFRCEELRLSVEPGAPDGGQQPVALNAFGTSGGVEWQASGLKGAFSLDSVSVDIGRRRVLSPKQAQGKLLDVKISAGKGQPPKVTVNWAQVVAVYMQSDLGSLMDLVRADVLEVLSPAAEQGPCDASPPPAALAASRAPAPAAPAAGGAAIARLQYNLSMRAPLVFLPVPTSRAPVACLAPEGEEVEFRPDAHQEFLVVDFGFLEVRQGAAVSEVQVTLTDARVLTGCGSQREAWKQVVDPLGLGLQLTMDDSRINVFLESPLNDLDKQHLSLTRPQLTLVLNIAAAFMQQDAGAVQPEPSARALAAAWTPRQPAAGQPQRGAAAPAKHISFRWVWKGPLTFDMSFTEEAPLAKLELQGGDVGFCSGAEGSKLEVRCRSLVVQDARRSARNADKAALRCAPPEPGAVGLQVLISMPSPGSTSGKNTIEVDLNRPILLVLPQWFMDLSTWSLSGYQHSALATATAPSRPLAELSPHQPPAGAPQYIVVRAPGAAVRAPARWQDPSDVFELAADVRLDLTQIPGETRFDKARVTNGKLCRVVQEADPLPLSSKFELYANGGSFKMSENLAENWRIGQLSLEAIRVPRTDVFLSVADAGALLGMVSEVSQFDAQSAEPAEELRQRDPLALTVQNKFSLVLTSFEVEGINLQLLEQSQRGGWARPALDIGMTAQRHTSLALQTAAGEPPRGSFKAEGVTLEARSFNECIGRWEPILAPSVWSCGCQAKQEQERVVELSEHEHGARLSTRFGAGSVVRAWYGDPARKWGAEGGKDVTEATKALLKDGREVLASNRLFGDPCSGTAKVLFVELRREAVLKTQVGCGPLQLVVTVPFVRLVNRLLSGPQPSGDAAEPQEVGKRGGMLQALNLSGVECGVAVVGGGGREVRLAPGETVPLDALAAGEQLPALSLRLPGLASDQVAVTLEALSSQVWQTRCGDMLVQVLMPEPPQRLLLITSTVSVRNSTPLDAEVRFLKASGDTIEAPAAPRHTPAATLQAPKRTSGPPLRREASVATKDQPAAPRGAQKLRGQITFQIQHASSLGKPEYRTGDFAKSVLPFGSGDYKVYVEVELLGSGATAQTEVVKAPRERVDIRQQLQVRLPEGTTLDLLRGTEIAVRVFSKVNSLRGALRSDPLIGEATLRLGSAEVSGETRQHRLQLLARRGHPQGYLELTVLVHFREVPTSGTFLGNNSASFARSSFFWTPSELDNSELKAWCQKVGVPTQGRERAELLRALESHRGAGGPPAGSAGGAASGGGDRQGVFRVPAGAILAAPLEAVGPALSRLQFRPAATGGAAFEWGDAVTLADLQRGGDGKMCFAGPAGQSPELPGSYLHLSLRTFGTKLQGCEVRIEAPFSVANGCPCEVLCSLGFWDHPRHLGSETDAADAGSDIVIADGCGGEWTVGPGGRASIFPLRLAFGGLCWGVRAGGEVGEWRLRAAVWGEANAVLVEREGRTVRWHFKKMEGFKDLATKAGNPFSVEPGMELPVMDACSEGLLLRIALRDQGKGTETTWSNPVPVVVPPGADQAQVAFEMRSGSQRVVLRGVRKRGRRLVLYVGTWFVDSTGLGIGISYRPDGACVQQFGNSVALLGEEPKDDNPQVYLRLPGREPVGVPVPIMGGSSRVEMSALHECALMVEPIATSSTFGVLCKLMSVVPGLMVFNKLQDRDIGFRQTGCEDMTWVQPGGSSQLYWTRSDKSKLVEIALKVPGTNWESAQGYGARFSAPRLISEAGVGAFPMSFQEPAGPKLACLHVDQAGELFSLTMAGENHCHQLENRHPCLTIRAYFEADGGGAHTEVPFGSRAPLARRSAAGAGRQQDRLCLELRDSEGSGRPHKMVIDLSRTAVHRVSEGAARAPRSEGGAAARRASRAVPASWVCVDICSRVGIVTVSPVVGASTADAVTWGYDLEVEVKSVGISLIGEKPHAEVFAADFRGLELKSDLTSTGRRAMKFLVHRLYVDLMRPCPVVVLSSLDQGRTPFLQLDMILEDVFSRDMELTKVNLCLTPLEVTADDTLIKEARKYLEAAVPRALGVDLQAALERARVPYNLSCGGPPAPSGKFVLHDVQVSQIKLAVFAKLRLDILPDWVYTLAFALSGFKDHLEVDGASLKLPEQQLFGGLAPGGCGALAASPGPFEGNLSAVFEHVQRRYTRLYLKALLSLLNNSNLILGGLLSRHRWKPKNRQRENTFRLPLPLWDEAIRLSDQDLDAFLREDNSLSFPMLRIASSQMPPTI